MADHPLLTPIYAEGIRLYRGPGEGHPALASVAVGEVLEVIENHDTALAKIGLRNQWIQVRNWLGVPGFVAAWQVQRAYRAPAGKPPLAQVPEVVVVKPAPAAETITPVQPPVDRTSGEAPGPAGEAEPLRIEPDSAAGLEKGSNAGMARPEPFGPVGEPEEAAAPARGGEIVGPDEGKASTSPETVQGAATGAEPSPVRAPYFTAAPQEAEGEPAAPPSWDPTPPDGMPGPQDFAADRAAAADLAPCFVRATVESLRIREGPGVRFAQIGELTPDQRLQAINPDAARAALGREGAWVALRLPDGSPGWCAAWHLRESPSVVQAPEGHALAGLHGPTDPDAWAWDEENYCTVQVARMEAVKLMGGGDIGASIVDRLRNLGIRLFLVRLYGNFRERRPASSFIDQVSRPVETLIAAGCRYFEVHNEPNIHEVEGMWVMWQNGREFGEFYLEVRDRLRERFPGGLFGWPGVSPGRDLFDTRGHPLRYDSERFLREAEFAVQTADFVCLHTYWGADGSVYTRSLSDIRRCAERYSDKLVFASEFSNNNPAQPKHAKANEYVRFYTEARQLPPNVGGVFAFALSASSGFIHETWRGSEIPAIVGRR
jgi:hypothetical protein